jgi:hypothetical protein
MTCLRGLRGRKSYSYAILRVATGWRAVRLSCAGTGSSELRQLSQARVMRPVSRKSLVEIMNPRLMLQSGPRRVLPFLRAESAGVDPGLGLLGIGAYRRCFYEHPAGVESGRDDVWRIGPLRACRVGGWRRLRFLHRTGPTPSADAFSKARGSASFDGDPTSRTTRRNLRADPRGYEGSRSRFRGRNFIAGRDHPLARAKAGLYCGRRGIG